LKSGCELAAEDTADDEGKPHKVRLLLASITPIQRHVKVKSTAQ